MILAFEFFESFCRRRFGITIMTLNAISFKGDSCNHSFINFVVSSMYCFPPFPDGKRNKFFFQYITCSYTVDTFVSNMQEGQLPHVQDFCGALDVVVLPVAFVDVSIHSCLSFAGSHSLPMFCLRDRSCWFKPLFDRKVLSQCRQI